MINQQSQKQSLPIRLLDFIDLNPSTIRNIFYANKLLFVSRQKYSDVFKINMPDSVSDFEIQQVLRLQPCEHFLNIEGLIVMIFPFELRIYDDNWEVHSFTTQLLSIYLQQDGSLYTFHEKQTIQWKIRREEKVNMKILGKHETPYHITEEGILEGYGKKIKPHLKQSKFTICEQTQSFPYIFIGSDTGHLHIYEKKYMTHVKTVKRHEAPILSIKFDICSKMCYFTGSDSKISSIKLIDQKWILSTEVRGQSHDIFSLEICGKYLISGGVTTDFCFYERNQLGQILEWENKVSYNVEKSLQMFDNYVFVNKISSLEIWKITALLENVQLLVKYDLPPSKHIKQIKIHKQKSSFEEGQYFIFMITEGEATGWKFHEHTGLEKVFTIANHYELAQFYPRSKLLIAIKNNTIIEKINYKNGIADQLCTTSVNFPTEIKISDDKKVLIASKYSQRIEIFNLKNKKLIGKLHLEETYGFIDFYNADNVIVHYFNSREINILNETGNQLLLKLPFGRIRFSGFIHLLRKKKKYWYGGGDGKIIVVSNFHDANKKKKIWRKQVGRIGEVAGQMNLQGKKYLGIVPLRFSRIQEEQEAVIIKKIQ